jgi:16S rRNA (cytidine1402-2'-O)-methyltransferase
MLAPPAERYGPVAHAASAAVAEQTWPTHTLYVVATPIGNLGDISLRALHALQMCDTLACEDTRHTQTLLRALGLDRAAATLLAVHQHNEQQMGQEVLQRLAQGQRVALVTDAGTPAISDPGARVVQAARAAGYRVTPLPGCSSPMALASVAGVVEATELRFVGFAPARGRERTATLAAWARCPDALVLLESPHRMADLLQWLATLGARQVTVGREMTKQFEQIVTSAGVDLALALGPQAPQGEYAVLLHPVPHATPAGADHPHDALLQALLTELPTKTAVKLAAQISGAARNTLYARALQLRPDARADHQADDDVHGHGGDSAPSLD